MATQSSKVRQRELHNRNGVHSQMQAATLLDSCPQATAEDRASANVPGDGQRQVAVGFSGEQPHNRLQSRPQSASAHKRKGWHALQNGGTAQLNQTGKSGNSSSVVYVRPDRSVNANIPLGNSPSFPSLMNVAKALPSESTASEVNNHPSSTHSSWASPRPKHTVEPATCSQGLARANPSGGAKYSAAVSPAKPKQDDSALRRNMAMSDSELTAITSLLSIHSWAEPGLARAVLAAVNHNTPAADLLLREMEQHQAPSGSDSDEESANHILPPEPLATEPADQTETLRKVGQGHPSPPQTLKAPAPPASKRLSSASSSRGGKQSLKEDNVDEDLYYKHRREALKLSKTWHKKLHQAANAFAGSHYSEGKMLATEAHQVRLQALAAHAEAAVQIEHANNAGRGLSQYELDLHGLHATEAVDALDRRLLDLGQLQHHSQASKLRVIVGRGNNSSGGEASLPRVIESHLLQRNMNYITGQGVITVYLRGLRH